MDFNAAGKEFFYLTDVVDGHAVKGLLGKKFLPVVVEFGFVQVGYDAVDGSCCGQAGAGEFYPVYVG
ncbi:hypothetical protein BHC51_01150 [Snodgrassella alvi]|nr:hypothetical protein BHC51_01150 [Snodgrassella alvi]